MGPLPATLGSRPHWLPTSSRYLSGSSTEGISGRESATKEMEELGARHQWATAPPGPQGGGGVRAQGWTPTQGRGRRRNALASLLSSPRHPLVPTPGQTRPKACWQGAWELDQSGSEQWQGVARWRTGGVPAPTLGPACPGSPAASQAPLLNMSAPTSAARGPDEPWSVGSRHHRSSPGACSSPGSIMFSS